MPQVSPSHASARREEILTAAKSCFVRYGLRRTSMREIQRESGLSAGALYDYFESKEAIVLALGEKMLAPPSALLAAAANAHDPLAAVELVLERIRVNIAALHAAGGTLEVRVQFLAEATVDSPFREMAQQFAGEMTEAVATALRAASTAGTLRADADPEMLAQALTALLQGLVVQLAIGLDIDIERYFATIRTLLESQRAPSA
jgi:AcrR family transcriptional regulator